MSDLETIMRRLAASRREAEALLRLRNYRAAYEAIVRQGVILNELATVVQQMAEAITQNTPTHRYH
jgi:hypothetical protein